MSRKALNRFLKRFDYEIVKIDRFKNLLERHVKEHEVFRFVQIGANDGVKFDYLYEFVTFHQCKGLVVEPLKQYFSELEKNYRTFPDIKPVNVAIHKSDKEALVYHVDPSKLHLYSKNAAGIGSFNPEHHKQIGVKTTDVITESVPCMHLMELIQSEEFADIDLLQVDVEGYDAEVIKMLNFDQAKPNIIKYEHESLDKSEQNQLKELLLSQGYSLFKQRTDTIAYLISKYP